MKTPGISVISNCTPAPTAFCLTALILCDKVSTMKDKQLSPLAQQAALSILRDCRDTTTTLDRQTIERLAATAGVKVVAIHVDLTERTVEYYTVEVKSEHHHRLPHDR